MVYPDSSPGMHIVQVAKRMVELANEHGEEVTHEFNGVPVAALPGDDPEAIVRGYSEECQRRHEVWMASPERKREQEERERKLAMDRAKLAESLAHSPANPTWSDQALWDETVAKNQDGYGGGVVQYAELWARLMEGAIASGRTVADCAKPLSRLADTDIGITGFMYGCAVGILASCWVHGEELRRWHNLDTQIGDEGKRANDSGGTLNPALLVLG